MDEARHVEVFSRYLDTKLSGHFQMNGHLGMLLDDIIADSRWDMTYLGMQIMVEGLALAAFGFIAQTTEEPLLRQLLRYVMADEARHVAFGVLSLQEIYSGMTQVEIRERQEFAFEAALRMRDRMQAQEVWARMGVAPKVAASIAAQDEMRVEFQSLLFGNVGLGGRVEVGEHALGHTDDGHVLPLETLRTMNGRQSNGVFVFVVEPSSGSGVTHNDVGPRRVLGPPSFEGNVLIRQNLTDDVQLIVRPR